MTHMTQQLDTIRRIVPATGGAKRPLVTVDYIAQGIYAVPRYTIGLVRETQANEAYPIVMSPGDVATIVAPLMQDRPTEALIACYLDTKNRVIALHVVSTGTLDSSLVHPRSVYQPALLHNAAGVIVAHNHPSGDPTPSVEDKRVTQRLYESGQLLGVDLLDHVVIGYNNRWTSLKQIGAF